MYCRKCYAPLDRADEVYLCPKCGRPFEPTNPRTYLPRPFPSKSKIFIQVIGTTIVAFLIASVVALFQIAGTSGH